LILTFMNGVGIAIDRPSIKDKTYEIVY
jgi:hypothetical protein